MRTYDYVEAQRNFSAVLNTALLQDVVVRKKDGHRFRIVPIVENHNSSPFDIEGINTDITTEEIIHFVRESRQVS